MWHWLSLMNFINLTNEYLYNFFVINNMTICKPIVKFVVSLTSIIKKCTTFKKKYNFINIWTFNHGKWGHFPWWGILFFGWALGLGLTWPCFILLVFPTGREMQCTGSSHTYQGEEKVITPLENLTCSYLVPL